MLRKTQAAAALIVDPAVLLLDEPFRGLDETSTVALLEVLQERKSSGGIIVISSHLKTIVEPLCDSYIEFPTAVSDSGG
jgi:ABC-2 type transport system ATP-binding protein